MNARLRWKLEPRETGLRTVGAGPRGSKLHDGTTEYAVVNSLGGGWRGPLRGWYWVAPQKDYIPYANTCGNPSATVEEAKAAALAYVSKHLAAKDAGGTA